MPLLIATLLLTAPAFADVVMTKDTNKAIVLTVSPDQSASIVDRDGRGALIEGRTLVDDKGNLLIHREEGDVCPDGRVRFGTNVADVTVVTEGAGTAIKNCDVADLEGRYSRLD